MKLITLLLTISLLTACQGKPNHNFTVSGKIKNGQGKIYLYKMDILKSDNGKKQYGPKLIDTTMFALNGEFRFQIKENEEALYMVEMGKHSNAFFINDITNIIIEKDSNNVSGFSAKNSKTSQELYTVWNYVGNNNQVKYNLNTAAGQIEIKKMLLDHYNNTSSPTIQFLTFLSILNLRNETAKGKHMSDVEYNEAKDLINQSLQKYPNNKYFKMFEEILEEVSKKNQLENNANSKKENTKLPSFSLPNTEGKTVSIDEFKGKYFLLDFWASWCGYCRQESPNLVKAYNQFKNKNFTIVSISLDEDREAWLKAIAKDKLTWTHLSDLKGWENQVAQMFGVTSIPFNLLVDPQGNIIASELREDALEQKLSEVLK